MGKFVSKVRKRFYRKSASQRLILFNIIVPTLIISGTISFIVSIFSGMPAMQQVAVAFAIVVLLIGFYIANWKNRMNVGAFIISASVTLILYPMMFFTGGGAESGMGYWMVLGILFSFLLIDGLLFRILVPMQVFAIMICFLVEYFYPETVAVLNSRMTAYVDIVQSMIILSVCVGLIFRFENRFYLRTFEEIRRKNEQIRFEKQRAEKASNAKSIFLSNVSNELRTPLDLMLQMNEKILQISKDEEILQSAAQIQEAAQVLQLDINNILDITQMESGKLEPKEREYETKTLILDCYHSVYRHAHNKKLQLVFECDEHLPCILYGDMQHLRQMWINMIIHAVKCMQTGTVYTRIEGTSENHKFRLRLYVTATADVAEQLQKEETVTKDEIRQSFDENDMEWNLAQKIAYAMNGNIRIQENGMSFIVIDIPQHILNDSPLGMFDVVAQEQENSRNMEIVREIPLKNTKAVQEPAVQPVPTEIEAPIQGDTAQKEGFLECLSAKIEEFQKEKALLYCAGDESLLQEMIREFTKHERIREIQQLYDAKDWKNYQIRVHSLKSTSLTLGFIQLHEEAKAIEGAVKEGNIEYAAAHHDELIQHYQKIIRCVENL